MIEYDGGFGEPGPLAEVIEQFKEQAEAGAPVRALHVGSLGDLEKRKAEADIRRRLEALEAKVEDLEPAKSGVLHLPTTDEIKALLAQEAAREVCGE